MRNKYPMQQKLAKHVIAGHRVCIERTSSFWFVVRIVEREVNHPDILQGPVTVLTLDGRGPVVLFSDAKVWELP